MRLSIIIPYYNTLEETKELLKALIPQLTNEVEVIVVDDGCNEKELDKYGVKVIHLPTNSGGASKPRNVGLDNAIGEYIAFIDSDDMVERNYIETILKHLGADILYISWRSKKHNIIMFNHPPRWNCSVWCRVYKRELIGNIRFDETLRIAEDWKFNEQIKPKTTSATRKQIYYYNIRENSLIRSTK